MSTTTPNGISLSESTVRALRAAVTDTFGADAPAEMFDYALEFWDDEYRHAQMLRAIDGYREPLNRAHVTTEACAAIRAC